MYLYTQTMYNDIQHLCIVYDAQYIKNINIINIVLFDKGGIIFRDTKKFLNDI